MMLESFFHKVNDASFVEELGSQQQAFFDEENLCE